MPSNPFVELLQDFRSAYATYGDKMFFLVARTRDEIFQNGRVFIPSDGLVGFVPLGDSGGYTGYFIYATVHRNRFGQWAEPWDEPYNLYKELASRAGASLALTTREQVPFAPAGPADWWLTYLWWLNPPSEEDLLPPDGEQRKCRAIWNQPFLESAEAIERGGLATDSPALLFPTPQKPRGRKSDSDHAEFEPVKGGAKKRKRRKRTELTRIEETVKLHLDAGIEQADIARKLDLTPGRISQIKKSIEQKKKSNRSVSLQQAKSLHQNITSDKAPALRTPRQRK